MYMRLLVIWILTAVVILAMSYLLPGVTVASFWVALVVAVVLSLVNLIVKPILTLLTLPLNILTLGLFSFVVSALMILLTDYLVEGFAVSGFFVALLMSLVIGVVRMLVGKD